MSNVALLGRLKRIFLLIISLNHFCFGHCLDIQKYVSDDEIRSIFNTANETEIPEYEIVEIFHGKDDYHPRKTRSTSTKLQLQAFGKNITLYLEPNDHVLLDEDTPVYVATKDHFQPFGVKYTRLNNVWSNDFHTYQDPNNEVAVTLHGTPGGYVNIDGTIGNNMVIKPLPPKIQNKLNHAPNSMSGFKNKPKNFWQNRGPEVTHHVVYRPANNPFVEGIGNINDARPIIWRNLFNFENHVHRSRRAVFDTVYPQLLIMLDYETFKIHNCDVQALTRYMAAFWNGVDLRYRGIDNPKVRLNIAGIIIEQEQDALPYMNCQQTSKDFIEDKTTLDAFGRYLHAEKRFSPGMFDIAVAITGLDMCVKNPDDCIPGSRGLAYTGGACEHDVGQSDLSIAILKDSGGFSGIITAAHELGHLFGAPHDGDEPLSYIGGPGAKSCNWNDGYLMSSNRYNVRGLHWSLCSIKAVQHFLHQEAYCLRNKPVVRKPYTKILPGTTLSRDEQCRKAENTIECKENRGECGSLWCVDPNRKSDCILSGLPAEGSPCANNEGICLDGQCVLKQKELISAN